MQLLTLRDLATLGTERFNTRRGVLTLAELREWLDLGEIIQLFNTWAVTDYGVECLVEYYPIEAKQLRETWIDHLSEKSWVTAAMIRDLTAALAYARQHFEVGAESPVTPAVRFQILRRDGYRCRLCGASASSGATLEVDHRVPRAQGGMNDRANLWTLCFDCNRGKRDHTL